MVSRRELFAECRSQLKAAGIDSAHFDTMCIFQDIFDERAPLMDGEMAVPRDKEERIRSITDKRSGNYPLQYLLGCWEFYGLPFRVGEGVLIPRPDTETLVEHVLDICRREGLSSPRIADLCSGSGCIAAALKKQLPDAEIYAVERSEAALYYLKANAELNGTDIHIISGDILKKSTAEALPVLDIIVSNPPYLTSDEMRSLQTEVTFEPAEALFGGEDGLGFYRAITELWKSCLRPGGHIAYEYGMGQHEQVRDILSANGFTDIELRCDTQGIMRTASAVNAAAPCQPQYTDHTVV